MKKLLLLALLPVVLLVACHKDLTSINVDPKSPLSYPSRAFFTSAQKEMVDLLTSTNVNDNIFRLVVQYWNETTYTDEANFDLGTRQIPRQVWDGLYRDVLRDIREAKKLFPNDANNPTDLKNQTAIAEIMEIYTWYYLVTTFGNVPYTESLDALKTQPVYDDQKIVFNDLLTRIDKATADLDVAGDSFGDADIVYGGDVAAWKKFANSFKL
ncbi:MAG: SusD/RagB family nutrient-binding outer membrane lipoprotein, partial [Chitinophagaceae bacterium]